MTYTSIAVLGLVVALLVDLLATRVALVRNADFWRAYAIILVFQLISNAVLTGREVVRYRDATIVGVGNDVAPPTMFGAGRVFWAPVEDLVFGFGLILLALTVWVWLGRVGLQPGPRSGPPRWRDSRSAR